LSEPPPSLHCLSVERILLPPNTVFLLPRMGREAPRGAALAPVSAHVSPTAPCAGLGARQPQDPRRHWHRAARWLRSRHPLPRLTHLSPFAEHGSGHGSRPSLRAHRRLPGLQLLEASLSRFSLQPQDTRILVFSWQRESPGLSGFERGGHAGPAAPAPTRGSKGGHGDAGSAPALPARPAAPQPRDGSGQRPQAGWGLSSRRDGAGTGGHPAPTAAAGRASQKPAKSYFFFLIIFKKSKIFLSQNLNSPGTTGPLRRAQSWRWARLPRTRPPRVTRVGQREAPAARTRHTAAPRVCRSCCFARAFLRPLQSSSSAFNG